MNDRERELLGLALFGLEDDRIGVTKNFNETQNPSTEVRIPTVEEIRALRNKLGKMCDEAISRDEATNKTKEVAEVLKNAATERTNHGDPAGALVYLVRREGALLVLGALEKK